jgi:hypothetical protein
MGISRVNPGVSFFMPGDDQMPILSVYSSILKNITKEIKKVLSYYFDGDNIRTWTWWTWTSPIEWCDRQMDKEKAVGKGKQVEFRW